jgi:hypothetical protein
VRAQITIFVDTIFLWRRLLLRRTGEVTSWDSLFGPFQLSSRDVAVKMGKLAFAPDVSGNPLPRATRVSKFSVASSFHENAPVSDREKETALLGLSRGFPFLVSLGLGVLLLSVHASCGGILLTVIVRGIKYKKQKD